MADDTPTRLEAFLAYALSAATTLLWIGCVLPAGPLATVQHPGSDAATPMHREPVLLVPALLLLVVVPAGCTLARRYRGMRAVLASTDAFVATYAGLVLVLLLWRVWRARGGAPDPSTLVAAVLLLLLGAASMYEAWRCSRLNGKAWARRHRAGPRLALCLLVLVLPLQFVVRPDVERASLLAPFFFVAISGVGVALARDIRGLWRTAAVLQLLLATHVLVTLRYTIYRSLPAIMGVEEAGQVTLLLSVAVVAIAALQVLVLLGGSAARAPSGATSSDPVTGPNR